ncbi:MAG: NAD(P)-dependent oxidoreductase [Anaerolineae bacterium]|nr:NAD(P)-dependent oxidoreductase [Candidatus Roseilinea sp.]MDW8450541.1 NAD(P)-dependent oxidoreductase [Anaerolineae bacterium]
MADTVLIIGGSGFIGTHLTKQLVERGDRVINYDMRPWGLQLEWLIAPYKGSVAFEQGGIESWPQLMAAIKKHKPNKIAHLAAPIDLLSLNRNPKMAFDVMVVGTINVLEACRLSDIERLVFFSSIGVLPAIQYQPIDANHPVLMADQGPGSGAYGAAKVAGEAFCWTYHGSYGLDFVIIRPSAAYGFYTTNPTIFINTMVDAAVRGEPVHFTSGREFPRDYTHVHDIAGIAAAALNVPPDRLKHRVFYAATGQKLVTAGQVADIIREFIPTAQIEIDSGLSEQDKLGIKYRGVHDMKPVEEQLGYRVKFSDIREGIKEYIETTQRYYASTR